MSTLEIGALVQVPGWHTSGRYMGLVFSGSCACSIIEFSDGSRAYLDCTEWTSFEEAKS